MKILWYHILQIESSVFNYNIEIKRFKVLTFRSIVLYLRHYISCIGILFQIYFAMTTFTWSKKITCSKNLLHWGNGWKTNRYHLCSFDCNRVWRQCNNDYKAIVRPPEGDIPAPVMKPAEGEAKNATVSPTSSPFLALPRGVFEIQLCKGHLWRINHCSQMCKTHTQSDWCKIWRGISWDIKDWCWLMKNIRMWLMKWKLAWR